MKSSLLVFSFAFLPLAVGAAGCAEEYDAREAAYPQQPVGYTQPGESSESQRQEMAAQEAAASQAAQAPVGEQAAPQEQQDVAIGATNDEYSDTDPAALTDFKPTLDPYGTWSEDATYGTVWTPSTTVVGANFSPYVTAGHWAYDDDYVWVSDYSWGWAPFHYGRWVYTGRGWGWIPGRTYAGAWVSWRTGYDDWAYVGWAPLPPLWYWRGGYAYGIGVVPYAPYAFCGTHDLFRPVVAGHVVTGSQVAVVAGHTRPYVAATPTPNGHVGATPHVNGPPPSQLRIPNDAIAHVAPGGDRGLSQARAFSKPATAQALGARPPAQSMAHNAAPAAGRSAPGNVPTGVPGQSPRPGTQGSRPSAPYAQNHAAPGYQPPSGYRPSVSPQQHAVPRYQPPAYSQPHASSQTLPRAPGYQPSAPSYSPAPHYNPPTTHYSPPATYSAPPAAHYAPPATHYAPPATHSAPPSGGSSPHYSAPSGGFHGGGGGGFRGGGGSRGGGGRR